MRIGEYFVSLKNYKIPLKTVEKSAQFDVNNPPPPGTEDELPISNDSYVSPLAMINRPSSQQTIFQKPQTTEAKFQKVIYF